MRRKILPVILAALAGFTASVSMYGQTHSNQSSSPAALYVAGEVEKQNRMVAVYTDFGDGRNRYTQRAALNPGAKNTPVLDEKAPSPFGTSCIKITYPLAADDWNGFIFMTGKLARGSIVPETDFGQVNTGQNLIGAKRLTFKARGENGGERVQFYMGGLANNDRSAPFPDTDEKHYNDGAFVSLTKEWKDYEIDLKGLNLSRIASGFGWVSNQPQNAGKSQIIFYLDEIIYEFDAENTGPLFLRSHEPVSLDKDEAFINNFAYIYDNAIAAMTLCYAQDYDKACQIADAFVYAARNDRYYPPYILRNAYFNGDPRSYTGWQSGKGEAFALIPGFYSAEYNEWWEDRYAVSINTGNIAWCILALAEVYRNVPHNTGYLETAMKLGDYVYDNFYSPDAEGGGYTGGYEGWEPSPENPQPPQKLTYKSTEHAIDLYIAYKRLAEIAPNQTDADRYGAAAIHARNFVLSMYDPAQGCFYTGTTTDGKTINKDNLPLDTNTWGILALWGDAEVAHLWDVEKVLDFIRKNFRVEGGEGLDFSALKQGVWFEGTSQYAVVLNLLGKTEEYARVMSWLNSEANADGSINAADRDNLYTGFDILIASNETESGLKSIPWVYNKRGALGATCWLAFAQSGANPYATPTGNTQVNVPKSKIWSAGEVLFISAITAGTAQVFTPNGKMIQSIPVAGDGTTSVSLPAGFYIIILNDTACKVRIGN